MISILSLFVITLSILILYLLLRTIKPKIHYNPSGKVSKIVSNMKSLKIPYKPTPWLLGRHLQTIYGMKYRKKRLNYRREIFEFEDKGTSALDIFDPFPTKASTNDSQTNDHAPILLIIHTLAGGSREPCSNNLAEAARRQGLRAIIFSNRGCSGVPFTSDRFYNVLWNDDNEAVYHYLKKKYEPSHFFVAGFSAGSCQAANFDIQKGELLDGVALISHPYDIYASAKTLSSGFGAYVYNPAMMGSLLHIISKNQSIVSKYPNVMKSKILPDFDSSYTIKLYGYKDVHEYYDPMQLHRVVPKFKAPTLVLCSDNDPMTDTSLMPFDVIEKSENCVFIQLAEGGHVSFVTGMKGEKSYSDMVVIDFFNTIMKIHK